jgi:hypothetical protein
MEEFLKREQASGNVLPKLLTTKPTPSLISKMTGEKNKNKDKAPRRALLEKAPAAATTGGTSSRVISGAAAAAAAAAAASTGGGGSSGKGGGGGGGYLVSQEELDTKNELRKSVWHYLRCATNIIILNLCVNTFYM